MRLQVFAALPRDKPLEIGVQSWAPTFMPGTDRDPSFAPALRVKHFGSL